jgi:flagellar hook-associated protein 3 FlgL
MSIRVPQAQQFAELAARLRENFNRVHAAQNELTTGRRVRTAADDPGAARRILAFSRTGASLRNHVEIADRTSAVLTTSGKELENATELLGRISERLVQALNDTASSSDRDVVAGEIDHLLDQLLQSANGSVEGRFLFGGTKTATPPFRRVVGPDGVERVLYSGDEGRPEVEVAPGVRESIGVPGSVAFGSGSTRGATVFSGGNTGVVPAAGVVDSAKGRGVLRVLHVATGFGAPGSGVTTHASGLAFGASGATADTVVGAGHVLQLDVDAGGAFGTVSLNGGPPVSFTTADADLAVTGPNGEIVHLDLRTAAAGYSGAITLGATGTLTMDGGATSTPIDFSSTVQALTAPDGGVVHVDASAARKAGSERVEYGGTTDVFTALLTVRDLLRVGGTDAERDAALAAARQHLDTLSAGRDRALAALSDVAGATDRVEIVRERVEELRTELAGRRSLVEDVDLSDAVLRLNEAENVYQSSLLTAAKAGQLSLLNFLR